MAEEQRLSLLQVGVTGHQHVQVSLSLVDYGRLQPGQRLVQRVHLGQHEQAQVGGDLVVARATGVQLAGHRADQFGQAPLDCRVDVFVAGLEGKGTGLKLDPYLLQAGDQLVALLGRDQARARQPAGVGDAALDVGAVQAPVKADRVVKAPASTRRFPPGTCHPIEPFEDFLPASPA